MANLISEEKIERKIFLIRGKKVMLDKDLAELYGVPTYRLNEQVKRNLNRFPEDFMFQLTQEEAVCSRSQFAILKQGRNIKYLPYAFTEQKEIQSIFDVIHKLTEPKINKSTKRIGFQTGFS